MKLHSVVRVLLIALAGVATMIVIASAFLISGDGSSDPSTPPVTPTLAASNATRGEPAATAAPPTKALTVGDIAEQFRQAVNGRDVESVAEFAPTATTGTLGS